MRLISIPASHESNTALKCKKCNHSLSFVDSDEIRPPYASFSLMSGGLRASSKHYGWAKGFKGFKCDNLSGSIVARFSEKKRNAEVLQNFTNFLGTLHLQSRIYLVDIYCIPNLLLEENISTAKAWPFLSSFPQSLKADTAQSYLNHRRRFIIWASSQNKRPSYSWLYIERKRLWRLKFLCVRPKHRHTRCP